MTKAYSVSVLVPAYNEEDAIEGTIRAVFNLDYPNLLEVIAINDGSKDKTLEILKKLRKEFPKLKILDKKNSGKADSMNQALKIAKGELIAVVDSDSFPRKDALVKSVGYFDDKKIGIVTVPILARNKSSFFEKLQAIDWVVVAFTRKLMEKIDSIFVTPGPLAIYRREAILSTGGFDPKNMTEDIEMTWHVLKNGWKIRMCLDTEATTLDPTKFKPWFKQRQRWVMGGMQTMWKYRKEFMRKGMLGMFILPFFILSAFLAFFGFIIFAYLLTKNFFKELLLIKLSSEAGASFLSLSNINLIPGILFYLGILLFIVGAIFTAIIMFMMEEDLFHRRNFFLFLTYLLLYPALGPFIFITAIFKLIKRDMSW
jgi:biofilm PGA synthesis N-glycosyltransferase PgaC